MLKYHSGRKKRAAFPCEVMSDCSKLQCIGVLPPSKPMCRSLRLLSGILRFSLPQNQAAGKKAAAVVMNCSIYVVQRAAQLYKTVTTLLLRTYTRRKILSSPYCESIGFELFRSVSLSLSKCCCQHGSKECIAVRSHKGFTAELFFPGIALFRELLEAGFQGCGQESRRAGGSIYQSKLNSQRNFLE